MNAALMGGIMKAAGINPDDIIAQIVGIKTAVETADARLARIEAKLDTLLACVLGPDGLENLSDGGPVPVTVLGPEE